MNRITLAIAFSSALGGGAVTYVANDDAHLTFVEPAPSAAVLSAEAAALYAPMAPEHLRFTHIIPRGIQSNEDATAFAPLTHASYSVPSTEAGLPPVQGEHWSATRSETVPSIVGLVEQVIIPAALATCPGLASARYPAPGLAQVEWVGVDGAKATARIVSRSTIAGLPPIECAVSVDAPPAALATVQQMAADYLVPAIKTERGLR